MLMLMLMGKAIVESVTMATSTAVMNMMIIMVAMAIAGVVKTME